MLDHQELSHILHVFESFLYKDTTKKTSLMVSIVLSFYIYTG